VSPLRGVRVRGLLLFVGRVFGGFAQNPSAVPVPRRRISASASQHTRIMETRMRMWPRIRFSHVEVTTNTVRETKAPGQFDMEANQGRQSQILDYGISG